MVDQPGYGRDRMKGTAGFADEDDRWYSLASTIEQLAGARSDDEVIDMLRGSARSIVGADGIAVVLKDGDQCFYVAEDAVEPLWAGQRFPAETCVSGWAMRHRQTAVIPDITADPRVPIEAYRQTFVRSLVMVPIGAPAAIAALGAYWDRIRVPKKTEVAMLEALARSAATAIENARLIARLHAMNRDLAQRLAELDGRSGRH
ncbi:GAF domain-containing protein [Sphingomonas sp. MM-1]|uniref:GAF domain-containing protein n=1 Tax=Sphingomonas sp. MM-1 TaxID=745310 RepID=UPI001F008EE3|nr:GAF domain-containing protein [Sphingomonas sp. MM-1]